jgi:phosphoribosylanthranilate isomerase
LQQIRSLYPQMKIIKGISVRTSDDVARSMPFSDAADKFLFDAKPPSVVIPSVAEGSKRPFDFAQGDKAYLPGGNGLSFDWNLLSGRQFSKPWMLSGGLNAENVGDAIRLSGAQMVDVSSSVESAPGVKDPALIEQFVKAVRQ